MFVGKVDLSPKPKKASKYVNKDTVEIAIATEIKNDTQIWCGLSSGSFQIVDLAKLDLKGKRVPAHEQLVTCMICIGKQLWSGSFDRTIRVTDLKSKKLIGCLTGHTDAVTCLLSVGNCVWSAGLDGQIIKWHHESRERQGSSTKLIDPKTKTVLPIYSLKIIDSNIWCGTGESIAILDFDTLKVVLRITSTIDYGQDISGSSASPETHVADVSSSTSSAWGMPIEEASRSRHRASSLTSSHGSIPKLSAPTSRSSYGSSSSTSNILDARARAVAKKKNREAALSRNSPQVPPSPVLQSRHRSGSNAEPIIRRSATPVSPVKALRQASSLTRSNSFGNRSTSGGGTFQPLAKPNPHRSRGSSVSPAKSKSADHQSQRSRSPMSTSSSTFTPLSWASSISGTSDVDTPSMAQSSYSKADSGHGSITESTQSTANTSTVASVKRHKSTGSTDGVSHLDMFNSWSGGGDAYFKSPPKMPNTRKRKIQHGVKEAHDEDSFDKVAASTILEGYNGQLWTCSDKSGRLQIWSIKTKKLLQSFNLECSGLHHMVLSRGHMWVAGSNGSVYIWDAEWHLPYGEIQIHSDAVRSLCLVGKEYVVSNSGANDGCIAILRAVARGRLPGVQSPQDQVMKVYDRYGFLTGSRAARIDDIEDDILSQSLPEEQKRRLMSQEHRQRDHVAAWGPIVEKLGACEASEFEFIIPLSLESEPELHLLGQNGIPNQYRRTAWTSLLAARLNDTPGHSKTSLAEVCNLYGMLARFPRAPKAARQIELDLLRTFPTNKYFRKGGPALKKLRRILTAFARHNSRVAYCQGFNFIVGFALLFLDEPTAFATMKVIIERIMPHGYYMDPMLSSRADQPVFRDAVKEFLPKLHAQLDKFEFDLSLVTFNWFFTLFVDCVPTELTVKIWDSLFIYGDTVLFQYAFAILKANETKILQASDQFELFTFMRTIGYECTDIDTIIHFTFDSEITKEFVTERRKFHRARIKESDDVALTVTRSRASSNSKPRSRSGSVEDARSRANSNPKKDVQRMDPLASPPDACEGKNINASPPDLNFNDPDRDTEYTSESASSHGGITDDDEDTLPSESRSKISGKSTTERNESACNSLTGSSWVDLGDEVEVKEKESLEETCPTPIEFAPRSSHITIFSQIETGGTGDGRLHPGRSLAASVDKWLGARLALARMSLNRPSPISDKSEPSSYQSTTSTAIGSMTYNRFANLGLGASETPDKDGFTVVSFTDSPNTPTQHSRSNSLTEAMSNDEDMDQPDEFFFPESRMENSDDEVFS